jgi:hypothetical protein
MNELSEELGPILELKTLWVLIPKYLATNFVTHPPKLPGL